VHVIWLDAVYLDAEDPDIIEQFVDTSTNTPRDPGADGSNPLDGDHAPLVCHKAPAAAHTVNAGTGGDADTAGVFTDGTSPGSYAGDFTQVNVSITQTDAVTSGTNANVWTYLGRDIGEAAGDRIVFVTSHSESGNGTPSCTINGIAATLIAVGLGTIRVALFALLVPTGTTADIVITNNGSNSFGNAIIVHRATGLGEATPTAHDSASTVGTSLGAELTIPNGGIAIAASSSTDGGANNCAWSNITETFDSTMDNDATWTSAIDVYPVGGDIILTPTMTTAGASDRAIFASFAPA
jgi:hypothetical protein